MKFDNRSPNRLGAAFIRTLNADFEANGAEAIERLRRDYPNSYLRLVMLAPGEFDLEGGEGGLFDDMDDDELRQLVQSARAALAAQKAAAEPKDNSNIVADAVDSPATEAIS